MLVMEDKKKKNDLIRAFTCKAIDNCELLNLSVSDLDKMRMEFPDHYKALYSSGNEEYFTKLK
jgi:hypothetical protein